MKKMTVVQFTNWLNVISSDISELKGNPVNEDRAINLCLYKLGMWVRERKAAPKANPKNMSDEDYAEMLARLDPFEAARIQREE